MTPQEIVDASTTVRQRMRELARERFKAQEEAVEAERLRLQGICAGSTGHLFAPRLDLIGAGECLVCVYCDARSAEREETEV